MDFLGQFSMERDYSDIELYRRLIPVTCRCGSFLIAPYCIQLNSADGAAGIT